MWRRLAMKFCVDFDTGDMIRCWVVPDNPIAISRIVIKIDGRRNVPLEASLTEDAFRAMGWHSTGQCAFHITEAHVPGLPQLSHLEIYEADTNVLLYRRKPAAECVQRRLLLINTSVNPETALQGMLFRHFQQSSFGIGAMSEEILKSTLEGRALSSCFLSGALSIPRYEHLFPPDLMLSTALIHDPHVEMATRLCWLRDRAEAAADPGRRWRLGRLAEAAAFTTEYDLADVKSLKRLFRMLPEPAYHFLYNPLTRQFGTRLPDDRVHPGNSIVAIEILARVGIVGHRSYFEAFATTLLDELGIQDTVPKPDPIPAEVLALADRLRGVKAVADMLVFDIAMADAVLSSVSKSWSR
ncbi:hypothetical protein AOPFMNJM_2476 [Methylobacterium jeotgali]|uniref:Uncharacterized protein n=3 Tax=Pseudomonadota TaxID=1224 RepID=A0ABQ4SVL9_9HYPH|nr:hypothetical protein AOPFMNJM_2476 [Methylobacterium jeotgali]